MRSDGNYCGDVGGRRFSRFVFQLSIISMNPINFSRLSLVKEVYVFTNEFLLLLESSLVSYLASNNFLIPTSPDEAAK